ncbi:MAG: orotidine-5'-phosphate decarboxylase [Clostridia bacterium]
MTTVWIALDVPDVGQAEAAVERLAPHRHFKVGLELFSAAGPEYVRRLVTEGYSVFLDLKLHDIPRTVERATARVRDLGVSLLTVHAAGGPAMLEGALKAAGDGLQVVAVTVLTSLDDATSGRLGLPDPLAFSTRLFDVARAVGATAFVTSAEEVAVLAARAPGLRYVVPGIRLGGDARGDQARVADPVTAVRRGATDLVLGRSVLEADNPPERLVEVAACIAAEEGGVRV